MFTDRQMASAALMEFTRQMYGSPVVLGWAEFMGSYNTRYTRIVNPRITMSLVYCLGYSQKVYMKN